MTATMPEGLEHVLDTIPKVDEVTVIDDGQAQRLAGELQLRRPKLWRVVQTLIPEVQQTVAGNITKQNDYPDARPTVDADGNFVLSEGQLNGAIARAAIDGYAQGLVVAGEVSRQTQAAQALEELFTLPSASTVTTAYQQPALFEVDAAA